MKLFSAYVITAILFSACLILPVYRDEIILPGITGIVLNARTGDPVENAKVFWIQPDGYEMQDTVTDSDGKFTLPPVKKYIKWKLIAMDPGWHGVLYITASGYKPFEISYSQTGWPSMEGEQEYLVNALEGNHGTNTSAF